MIKDTVLIFGRSPFLKEIDINSYLNKGYTTIGINNVNNIPFDYVAFVDKVPREKCTATIEDFQINKRSIILTRSVNKAREPVIYFDNKEWWFTHDYVLRWLKGKTKRVILVGAADFCGGAHYDSEDKFSPSDLDVRQSIGYTENVATKWFDLYKLNPNGKLNIPIIEGL